MLGVLLNNADTIKICLKLHTSLIFLSYAYTNSILQKLNLSVFLLADNQKLTSTFKFNLQKKTEWKMLSC